MLPDIDVDNVFIYISDATRLDFAPIEVLNRGLQFRTIASGIHSPTSIASIVSGTYLPQHHVGDFSDTLPSDVPNLLEANDVSTRFANTMNDVRFDPGGSEDIIADTLDVDAIPPEELDEVEPPFIFVERGPGGHAPYVQKHELDTGQNYFRDRGAAPRSRFADEYTAAIEEDTEWFLSRLALLEERDLLESTVIIYTSDHGEMLGESGMQSHAPPIHPRHVYVPTVFIHPKLPEGQSVSGVLRHVDIQPTVSGMLDIEVQESVRSAGRDLTEEPTGEHGCAFYSNPQYTRLGRMDVSFDSVWDRTGGYVFPRTGRLSRLMLAAHYLFRAPWRKFARENALSHLWFKLRGDRCHWSPALSTRAAKSHLKEVRKFSQSETDTETNEVPKDRLQELGYY